MENISDKAFLKELERRFEENAKTVKELKDLNLELKIVNKKLEESEALKSHFISNITNEIINPFTSILALSKAILSVSKENWKKVISMVALIHSEAFNLDFQLRNIFMAAKLEAGEIFPEIIELDVEAMTSEVIESFQLEANKKQLEINFELIKSGSGQKKPLYFKTDPDMLRIILSNLLNNAVKFSYQNHHISVKAGQLDKKLFIEVKDFGVGFSEENQKIIFDRFKRLDSDINSINHGHGLGLSISKALIDILNGQIEITSTEGKGSTFIITISEPDKDATGFSSSTDEFLFDQRNIF